MERTVCPSEATPVGERPLVTSFTFPCSEMPRVRCRPGGRNLLLAVPRESNCRVAEGGNNDLAEVDCSWVVRRECFEADGAIELSRERTNPLRFSPSRTMFSNLRMSAADKMCWGPKSRDSPPGLGLLGISSSQKDDESGLLETDGWCVGMAV